MNSNKDEIGVLWDKNTPKLYGYLINTLKDRPLADDILQTTWLKAIEAFPSFHDRGHGFSAWLFSIARNEMKMHWRKSGREISYDPSLHDSSENDSSTEDKIMVDEILAKLPIEDRELIRLRYIADLPFGQIAKILNLNPINVRVKMHRVLAKTRNIIQTQNHE